MVSRVRELQLGMVLGQLVVELIVAAEPLPAEPHEGLAEADVPEPELELELKALIARLSSQTTVTLTVVKSPPGPVPVVTTEMLPSPEGRSAPSFIFQLHKSSWAISVAEQLDVHEAFAVEQAADGTEGVAKARALKADVEGRQRGAVRPCIPS